MGKKSSALSRRAKQHAKSTHSTLSTELKRELTKLTKISDKKTNLSDIPELDFDKLRNPLIGKFYRPMKTLISIRMDSDVLYWFKQHTQYQKLINYACRLYMEGNKKVKLRK